MPLQRRVPKFGFTNPNRVEYKGINLDTLQMLVESKKMKSTIVFQDLIDNGLVGKKELVKILGRGELSVKLDITAHAFSKSAVAAIEAKGGSATIS
jgi:large subunit ribosomal protein L15